jgi:pimeloyl-ACP methyl ester carboxylesterase
MTSIHVTRWGTSGPQVLMIHGGPQGGPGGGAQIFAGQRPLADRGWRLVLPDRPGHGQSPSRGPEDMEKDAVWVAEMLGDGSHLLGHSYGALVALAAVGLRPGAVRSLTLVEAPLLAAAPDHPDVKGFVAELVRIETADLDPLPRLMQFSALIGIPIDLLPPPSIEHLVAMAEGLATMRSPADWDGAVPLAAVATAGIPTLAITGAGAPAFGAMADGFAAATRGEHRVIHAGHHFPQLLAGEFNDVLEAFLREAERNVQQ